jgi:hypothetical protein
MQGVAGIAAYLFRLQRVLDGGTDAVARMDNWWALRPERRALAAPDLRGGEEGGRAGFVG